MGVIVLSFLVEFCYKKFFKTRLYLYCNYKEAHNNNNNLKNKYYATNRKYHTAIHRISRRRNVGKSR